MLHHDTRDQHQANGLTFMPLPRYRRYYYFHLSMFRPYYSFRPLDYSHMLLAILKMPLAR